MKKKDTKQKKEELAAISEVFGKACKTQPKKASKSKKTEREVIALPKPFDLLVAGSILAAALNRLKAKAEYANIKAKVFDLYFKRWTKDGEISPSIVGQCDQATALFTLRKMTGMTEETAKLLKKNKVPFHQNEIVLEGLVLNPDIMFDQDLLGELALAVKKVKAFQKISLFMPQDAITTYAISSETFNRASKIKNEKEREKVLKALTSISMSQPKFNDESGTTQAQAQALKLLAKKGVFQVSDADDDDDDDDYDL